MAVDAEQLLTDWFHEAQVKRDRPRVSVNFAMTSDGAIALSEGVSGGIGDLGDRAVFRGLRDRCDAILAGTQTIATEGYGRLIRDSQRREQRTERGLAADPLSVIVSRSGELPISAPIFESPEQQIVAFVPPGAKHPDSQAQLEMVELDQVSTSRALELLGKRGVRSIVCEGGPKLVSGLAADNLVDDIFLTIAPLLAGGGPTGLVNGQPLATPEPLSLQHIAERDGSIFIRWSRSS